MKICAIVAASGSSTRFGCDKLEIVINDKPMLAWSVALLAKNKDIFEVVVATSDINKAKRLTEGHIPTNVKFVMGGACREESVKNAFETLPPCDVVLVHDGARPFANDEIIKRLFSEAKTSACVIPVILASSAVKRVVKDNVIENLQGNFHLAQTPQLVWSEPLKFAFKKYFDRLSDFNDEASIIAAMGLSVVTVPGFGTNIKVTTQDDLFLAKAIAEKLYKRPDGLYPGKLA